MEQSRYRWVIVAAGGILGCVAIGSMFSLPVLIILAVLWAVVLVPPLLRSRGQRSADSIVDFNYKLDMLGRMNGSRRRRRRELSASMPDASLFTARPVGAPPLAPAPYALAPFAGPSTAAQRSARRRRAVMQVLGGSVIATLLLATGEHAIAFWLLQIAADVLAAAYLALWAWVRSLEADRIEKVRYIPELRVPELALRRSASS